MKKLLPVIALAIFAVLGGTWFLTQSSNPSDPILGSALAQEAGEIDTSTVAEMILGNPDAAVEVIEYASFTCPHCAAFHANQFQELKANYIDTGLIKFVYREI